MSTGTTSPGRAKIPARTLRTDRWWVSPLLNAAGLAFFLVYGTFRIFYDQNYWVEEFHYLAPFYSPCLSEQLCRGVQPLPRHPAAQPALVDVAGDVHPDLPAAASGPPATTTARPTTGRSGSRRRPAPSPSRTRPTPARPASR